MEPTSLRDFLFSFQGRIRRSEYWLRFSLPAVAVAVVLSVIDVSLGTDGVLPMIFNLIILYPSLAINVKRCHDRNRSGWFMLINIIPLVGAIWYLVEVGFLRGTPGENRFGPDPVGEPSEG